jgi:hypothetical protein
MKVQLFTIDALFAELGRREKESFVKTYPGTFLLAMGLLEVEKIRAACRTGPAAKLGGGTLAVSFGLRLRHAAGESHPLAGCAFFLRPTSDQIHLTLGRAMECDITIPDPSVSDIHSIIEVRDDDVFVADNDSTNGTTVNLQRLEPHQRQQLSDEDILSLGRYSFQVLAAKTLYGELSLLKTIDELDSNSI